MGHPAAVTERLVWGKPGADAGFGVRTGIGFRVEVGGQAGLVGTNTYSWRTLLPWIPACRSLRNCFEPLTSLLGSWSVIPVAWSGFPFKSQVPTPSKQAELSSWVGSPAVLLVGHVGNRTSDDVFSYRLPPPHPSSAVCPLSLSCLPPRSIEPALWGTHISLQYFLLLRASITWPQPALLASYPV